MGALAAAEPATALVRRFQRQKEELQEVQEDVLQQRVSAVEAVLYVPGTSTMGFRNWRARSSDADRRAGCCSALTCRPCPFALRSFREIDVLAKDERAPCDGRTIYI